MNVNDLLVGDLVQVETGEKMSVDGVIVRAKKIYLNQSAITGEPDDIKKEDYALNSNIDCFLISGTKVMSGTAMMLVLAVGKNSYEGKLKLKLQQDDD